MRQSNTSVFISYRRTDAAAARLVYSELRLRGFDAFLDHEGLGRGQFATELLDNIAARAHFLLILTPGALDRIAQPDDWLRREVEHALALQRNVVPLFFHGFDFADQAVTQLLAGRLDALPRFQGVRIHFEYFDAAIDRLDQRFLRPPVDVEIRPLSVAAASVAQQQQLAADHLPPVSPPQAQVKAAPVRPLPAGGRWPADAVTLVARHEGSAAVFRLAGGASAQREMRTEALDALARDMTRGTWMPEAALGHALFQMLLPAATRVRLREAAALLLDVDETLGALPWELMQAGVSGGDAGLPLGVRCPLVRRLEGTAAASPAAPPQGSPSALIVANPSTAGFADAFAPAGPLVSLAGARREGEVVAETLRAAGWSVQVTADEAPATEVLAAFYAHPWRVLHVAGHGVVALAHPDGRQRSGAVLSDGLLLTASDVVHLEQPPELVVMTCEHFGSLRQGRHTDDAGAGLVRALHGAGVRGIVLPAWNVSDEAACTFSAALYRALFAEGADFGSAVLAARGAVWREHPGDSTWASFQAWGDPHWRP